MKTIIMLAATAALFSSAPVLAQTNAPAAAPATTAGGVPAGVTVGATIKDQAGGVVGTVQSIGNGTAVVSTGKYNAALPFASFAATPTGPIISLTKDQLEAQIAQQTAQSLDQALKVGATVHGPQGATDGTVDSIAGDQVVVTTPKGKAMLPKSAFAADASGSLMIGMTPDQLNAAMAGASHGGSSGAGNAPTAPTTPPSGN